MTHPFEQIVGELVGSNSSPDTVAELFGMDIMLTTGLAEYIDEHIFMCDQCGWWCPNEELAEVDGDRICEDCNEG